MIEMNLKNDKRKNMSDKELSLKVKKGFIWVAFSRYLTQAVSWITTIFVARLLSPRDYGLMGMAFIYYNLVFLLMDMGFTSAIIQKKGITRKQVASLHNCIILFSIFMFIFSVFVSPYIASYFNEPELRKIIIIISINLIILGLNTVPNSLLIKEMKFNISARAELMGNLSGSFLTLFLAIKGYGVYSLVYGFLTISFIKTFYIYLRSGYWFVLALNFQDILGLIKFGFTVTLSKIVYYAYSNSDFLFAGKMLGKKSLGAYSLAFQLASIPLDKFGSIINQVLFPAYSIMQDDMESLKSRYLKSLEITTFIVYPVLIGLFSIANDLIMLLLTDKWENMIFPFKVLLLASVLRFMSMLNPPILTAINKPYIGLINLIICSILMIPSFYIGAKYGIKELSLVWLIVYPVAFLFMIVNTLRFINITLFEYLNVIYKTAFITIAMAIFIYVENKFLLFNYEYLLRIIINIFSGALFYIFGCYVLEKQIFKEIIKLLKVGKI